MTVWERSEPEERPAPAPLSRGAIVRAAVELADRDGLDAVSMRRVAAALGVGPMRLYGYLATKEELLDLMLDAVYAEVFPTGDGWREVLRSLAETTRRAARHHEWLADLMGGRPTLGPNGLARGEAVLAHLDGLDVDLVMPVVAAVEAFTIGAVRREVGERRAARASGLDTRSWQSAVGPYLERQLDGGRLPALAAVVRDAVHHDADQTFRIGLELLLDGIGATIAG